MWLYYLQSILLALNTKPEVRLTRTDWGCIKYGQNDWGGGVVSLFGDTVSEEESRYCRGGVQQITYLMPTNDSTKYFPPHTGSELLVRVANEVVG